MAMSAARRFYSSSDAAASSNLRIAQLAPNVPRSVLLGLVIVKNSPRFVANRQGCDRFVLNFTLRDSRCDTINATCWGSEQFIGNLAAGFTIGHVVEVHNAEISLLRPTNDALQYKPKASSPFGLVLNESTSSVRLSMLSRPDLEALVNVPLGAGGCPSLTTLAEVQENSDRLNGQHVNLLVSVKKVGVPRELVSSKSGQPLLKCNVIVFDQTLNSFVIQLWDAEWIQYAKSWTPRDCVVLVQDARLRYDDFRKTMVATSDGRTAFITNPECREALMLYTFSQTVACTVDDAEGDVDLQSIQDVYTVEGLLPGGGSKVPFRGILYACLTAFDVDGSASVTSVRCSACQWMAAAGASRCPNADCGAALEAANSEQFDVAVSLADHTGTVARTRLRGGVAEALLGCTVRDFHGLSAAQRTSLKWHFLMERFKCYFEVDGRCRVRLLSVEKADVQEACAKTPPLNVAH